MRMALKSFMSNSPSYFGFPSSRPWAIRRDGQYILLAAHIATQRKSSKKLDHPTPNGVAAEQSSPQCAPAS